MNKKPEIGDLFKRVENNSSLNFLNEIGIILSVYETKMWRYAYLALINNQIRQVVVSRHAGYTIEILQNA